MDLLILGLSSIVTRRVLPALRSLPTVGRVDLATRKAGDPEVTAGWTHGRVFPDYLTALRQSRAPLVYVSLVNSEHERWARGALEHGFHVVVDKPAFLGCEPAEDLLDLAAKQGRCLAEATVFGYHPQIAAVKEAFAAAGSELTRISALFTFPPMDPTNFRYRSVLGGGALWDVGPYAVATGRIFFGEEPTVVACQTLARGGEDVEIAFSALQVFPSGGSLVGHFGFDAAYCNRLTVIGNDLIVDLDRAFTTPPDFTNSIRVSAPQGTSSAQVAAADSFALFFGHLLSCVSAGDWTELGRDLLADARTLERLRKAAGAGSVAPSPPVGAA